jgi:L-lactate dehydrogenase complex protein LldE
MQVALMIPCYIDLFYPEVGVATLELLEKLKVDVVYPFDQTCCAQPMANGGCYEEARATEELFIKNFSAFDHIVTPSGSCTLHLRNKFTAAPDSPERRKVSASVYDLVEFLHDVLQVRDFPWAKFEHKVALHTSCSAIRVPRHGFDERTRTRRQVLQAEKFAGARPGNSVRRVRKAGRMLRLWRNLLSQ